MIERGLPSQKQSTSKQAPAADAKGSSNAASRKSPGATSQSRAEGSSWADITPQDKSSGALIRLNLRNRNPAHTCNHAVERTYFANTSSHETAPYTQLQGGANIQPIDRDRPYVDSDATNGCPHGCLDKLVGSGICRRCEYSANQYLNRCRDCSAKFCDRCMKKHRPVSR